MLMTREHETVEAGGLGHGGAFTIAASEKAFEILSNSLYQNKTLAVIREITCNAVDAHTVAGLPIRDIKVHLPTFTEPYFAVRDFGSGMSESDIMSLYTTYFRSTKDLDNTQIGGFGLGSKSPFAVTDQFTVTSWHGGTKTTYVCYKQDGMPRVNNVGSVPCGAETGIEVRVPLTFTSGSVITWQAEARSLFRWWPILPECNVAVLENDGLFTPENIALQSDRHIDGAPEWTIFKAFTHNTIIMGNVPYSLNEAALKDVPPTVQALFQKVRVAIRVPMGSVSISPSRETLSYDSATIAYLVAKLKDVTRDIVTVLERELDGMATLACARRMVHGRGDGSLSHLFLRLKDIVKPRWQRKPVPEQVTLDLKTAFSVPATAFDYLRRSHWTNFQRETYDAGDTFVHTFPKYDSFKVEVLWTSKVTSKTYATLKHNYGGAKRGVEARLHVLSGVPYQELVDKCLELGIPKPMNIDTDLEAPPKAEAGSARTPSTQHYEITVYRGHYSYGRLRQVLDLKDGGFYVTFAEGVPLDNNPPAAYAQLLCVGAVQPVRIVGIPRAKLAFDGKFLKALAANGWKELDAPTLQVLVDMPKLLRKEQELMVRNLHTHELSELRRKLLVAGLMDGAAGDMWPGFEDTFDALGPHLTLFRGAPDYDATQRPCHYYTLKQVLSAAQYAELQKVLASGETMRQSIQAFLAQHPLLAYVHGSGTLDLKAIREYVNR